MQLESMMVMSATAMVAQEQNDSECPYGAQQCPKISQLDANIKEIRNLLYTLIVTYVASNVAVLSAVII